MHKNRINLATESRFYTPEVYCTYTVGSSSPLRPGRSPGPRARGEAYWRFLWGEEGARQATVSAVLASGQRQGASRRANEKETSTPLSPARLGSARRAL
ncbi:hypothetical protein INR49_032380 [Caranx melampygus]|nr:hypothetical protein INR49_032380 [Caranx melampygus]